MTNIHSLQYEKQDSLCITISGEEEWEGAIKYISFLCRFSYRHLVCHCRSWRLDQTALELIQESASSLFTKCAVDMWDSFISQMKLSLSVKDSWETTTTATTGRSLLYTPEPVFVEAITESMTWCLGAKVHAGPFNSNVQGTSNVSLLVYFSILGSQKFDKVLVGACYFSSSIREDMDGFLHCSLTKRNSLYILDFK